MLARHPILDDIRKAKRSKTGRSDFGEVPLVEPPADTMCPPGVDYPSDLDPLMIKAQISMESSFNAGNHNRIAKGLMGITGLTREDLAGKQENGHVDIRRGQLVLRPQDLFDPVVNIAAGLRWLGYKYSMIRRLPRNAESMFRYYKDAKTGEAYAKEVLRRYRAAR